MDWEYQISALDEMLGQSIFAPKKTFYDPGMEFGGIVFSACLSICGKNFNIGHNFWTIIERDLIFGMHTQLMKPFQMKIRSMTLTDLYTKNSQFGLCCRRRHLCLTNTPSFQILPYFYNVHDDSNQNVTNYFSFAKSSKQLSPITRYSH